MDCLSSWCANATQVFFIIPKQSYSVGYSLNSLLDKTAVTHQISIFIFC